MRSGRPREPGIRSPPLTDEHPTIVTGAAGWLGTNLVRSLVADGRRVRGLVLGGDDAAFLELLGPQVEVVVGDVRDPDALDRLFEGAGDADVFHTAAVIHPRRRTRELFDTNVGGTELVLDQARRVGVRRLVHVSSNSPFGVNPDPASAFTEDDPYRPWLAYGESKQEAEALVVRAAERGDVHSVIVRAPWFYGPYQPARQTRFLRAVRRGRFPVVGDGRQRRSMVYVGNLVDGLRLAADAEVPPGRAYWVADARPYELGEIIETVRAAFDAEGLACSGRPWRLPRAVSRAAEAADRLLQAGGRYHQALHVLGELGHTIACDVSRARAELGYEPAVDLFEGMRRSIRWCLARGEAL